MLRDWETNLGYFDILFCPRCKIGYTNPYPTEATVSNLYKDKNSTDFDAINNSFVDKIKDILARQEVSKLIPKNNHNDINEILDFGTGNGRYALAFNSVYSKAIIRAVDYQKEKPNLFNSVKENRIQYFYIDEFLNANNNKFDIIFLRHVLEHSYDPVGLIKCLSRYLRKGGLMYVEVPNLDSACAKLFKKSWRGYSIPRHICHFTGTSLGKVLSINGFEYSIKPKEMPWMGNQIAILFKLNYQCLFVKVMGVILHPLQIFIERIKNSSTCLALNAFGK